MSIKIRLHPFIAGDYIQSDLILTEGKTVGICIGHLLKRFPSMKDKLFAKNGQLHGYIEVYVNEESAYPHELAMPVNDGDEISITCILAGG